MTPQEVAALPWKVILKDIKFMMRMGEHPERAVERLRAVYPGLNMNTVVRKAYKANRRDVGAYIYNTIPKRSASTSKAA